MANKEHLARLERGVEAWNQWRKANDGVQPDLSWAHLEGAALQGVDLSRVDLSGAHLEGADLFRANLSGANLAGAILTNAGLSGAILTNADLSGAILTEAYLSGACLLGANLSRADLSEADLEEVDLSGRHLGGMRLIGVNLTRADLSWAYLNGVDLSGANLTRADLTQTDLSGANLTKADLGAVDLSGASLTGANLSGAHLGGAVLVGTTFEGANLSGCRVYGTSAWNVNLRGAHQSDLVITPDGEPEITVDNVEVAQFIYLLLHNEKIREVIDTITSKAVLILGRFTAERKAVLDAMREELRCRNYLPILFDFEKPASRNFTETISTLAHMARFIIADITDARSIPQELQRIVPDLPSVPVQPILQAAAKEYGMFPDFKDYPWVLETYQYESLAEVIAALPEKIIAPAEVKAKELLEPRRQ
jgi:uncharacterized protein YjbI with pentapeptide repeats